MIVTLSADGASKSRADVEAGLIAEMNAVNATLENHEQIGKIIVAKERSEEHTSELQSLMSTPYAVVRSKKKNPHYPEQGANTLSPLDIKTENADMPTHYPTLIGLHAAHG